MFVVLYSGKYSHHFYFCYYVPIINGLIFHLGIFFLNRNTTLNLVKFYKWGKQFEGVKGRKYRMVTIMYIVHFMLY